MTTTTDPPARTVRFGQRQSRGLLLGLSALRAGALGFGLALAVAGLALGGILGCAITSPLWVTAIASAFARWNGAPAIEAVPVLGHYLVRSALGQTRYLRRISAPRPAGTMALPGDAAALRFHLDPTSGAAMIHDPHRRTLSAVLHVTHPAYVLLAPDDRGQRVTGWSRALAGLAASGTCAAVQVLESTLPDPGLGVRQWWAAQGVSDAGWAARQYAELMDSSVGSSKHRTTITLSVDLGRASRAVREAGRGMTGGAAVLRSAMTAFETSLAAASLGLVGWLGPEELAVIIRQAYDPEAEVSGDSPGASLTNAGPVSVSEHWDHLRHDSGYSAVLWISEWPRIEVAPHFLHALIFTPEVRKSLSIVARPLQTTEALRQIRKDKVEYVTDAAQKARIGQLVDLADEQQYVDVLDRERALISGHADLEFSGFLAVTAPTRDSLAAAVSAVELAAISAGCETRVVFGRQSQAFAVAALPLGRSVR
jgi:hypothetical protein